MLDPGRYFAEAIYFLQYTFAQILWAISRSTLSIAIIAESINSWITDNIGYFVELLVNALSAPLGGFFILALTALGFWYGLNNILPTSRWVDPGKLFSYGLITFFFFSSPIVAVDLMEELRQSLNAGIDAALIDGASGDMFTTSMDGTDPGLPGAIPDVNSDGVIGSFDLVSAFMAVANIDELDSSEFPVDFEATYFPFGDPSGIDLSDEADQELAKALASDGIERLFFALVAIPTAIAEHFLRLALTGVAMLLYAGVPIAMLFAFFIYTQAFLGAYLRQFVNLLIETFLSVIIVALMIGLLVAAAQQGVGLYIGASIIAFIVILWRIKSALKLGTAAFDLFGGAMLTGGVGGMELANMGKQAVVGTIGLAGAALTGGATLAAGGAVLTSAAALQADGRSGGTYLGTDPDKTEGRVRQLKTIAGYTLGRSDSVRHLIEGSHEMRTLARNFRDGEVQPHDPDLLDYLRAGSSMSGFGSSPWLAMRFSPSLRAAYDEIGGRRTQRSEVLLDDTYDQDGEPVRREGNGRTRFTDDGFALWRDEPATPGQLAYLRQLGVTIPEDLNRGQASDLIAEARQPQRVTDADTGRRVAAEPASPDRFAALEQALHRLTQALTHPETAVYIADNLVEEAVNGPIPDWLRAGRQDTVQQTSAVSTDPVAAPGQVLDHDPRAARHELPPTAALGTVRLEPYQDSRRQVMHDTLARLADPHTPAGQAAYKTVLLYAGQHNADLVQTAVTDHSAAAVQAATTATADLIIQYRQQGMSDADQLAAFQTGAATATIRAELDTPLTDAQLTAVADMVMLPQRYLTRTELVTVIGREAATGALNEQAVAQALAMPVGFAGQTGNVRGVLAGARAMQLSPADMTRLAAMIQDGLRDVVQAELVGRGHRPSEVQTFVTDLAALPTTISIPQSAAASAAAVSASNSGEEHA